MSETTISKKNIYSINIPRNIRPSIYKTCEDIGIITCYFNPSNYKTKFSNFKVFENIIRKSNIYMMVVECAFGDTEFTLNDFPNVLKVRSQDILWQKERLLNIAVSKLPERIKKVVWLDCDVLFANQNWLVETSRLLDEFPVVQPFEIAVRLPKDDLYYKEDGEVWNSFSYIKVNKPKLVSNNNFQLHGHTGFAWAARKDLLKKHGLYHAFISGIGDHLIAHAMCGDFNHPCINRMVSGPLRSHFLEWGQRFHQDVKGKVGYTSGVILHLWHGETENRQYLEKHDELLEHNFDPSKDICVGDNGTLSWNSNKPKLHQWALQYFYDRKEDENSKQPN